MKLAEALQERADLNRSIQDLRGRLERVMLVQEGEEPVENPEELLGILNGSVDRLEYLAARINHTNGTTKAGGMTLTEIISKKEIRVLPTVRAADLQKEADRMAKEIRTLDNLLQETNWTKELVE